jgi:hypothetical protein
MRQECVKSGLGMGLIVECDAGSLLTLNDPRVMTLVRVKVAQKSGKVDPP